MADDEYMTPEEAAAFGQRSHDDALADVRRIQDALAPHVSSPEQLEEATHAALRKFADPVGAAQEAAWIDQEHARLQAELATRNAKRHEQIAKLRAAYRGFDRLPDSMEKYNYQNALRSMLGRYGAKP